MRRNHRDLKVWQESTALVDTIYQTSSSFPPDERFGLTTQLRRAAVSVPANISEGCARMGTKELLHYLSIAQGSLFELDTLIEIALRLGCLNDASEITRKIDAVSGLVMGLAASLRRRA
jgi:four helix bundle protein